MRPAGVWVDGSPSTTVDMHRQPFDVFGPKGRKEGSVVNGIGCSFLKRLVACAHALRCRKIIALPVLVGVLLAEVQTNVALAMRAPPADIKRRVEALAAEAADSMRASAWGFEISPVIRISDDLETQDILAYLVTPIDIRPRGEWKALRLGVAIESVPSQRRLTCQLSDDDLNGACALLVRYAALARLEDDIQFPPDTLRQILEALPRPPLNPGATPGLRRAVARLERAGKLSTSASVEARALCADLNDARLEARVWVGRFEDLYLRLTRRADGAEGRAIVQLARALRFAEAGWDAQEVAAVAQPSEFRASVTHRTIDRVGADIRLARTAGCACHALAEMLVAVEPIERLSIESMIIDADSRLRVGRRTIGVTEERIDRWRRDCGIRRTERGWEGESFRPRPRTPRLRDAPFGIKPLSFRYPLGDAIDSRSISQANATSGVRRSGSGAIALRARAGRRLWRTGDGGVRAARARGSGDSHDHRPRCCGAFKPPAPDPVHGGRCGSRCAKGRSCEGTPRPGQRGDHRSGIRR